MAESFFELSKTLIAEEKAIRDQVSSWQAGQSVRGPMLAIVKRLFGVDDEGGMRALVVSMHPDRGGDTHVSQLFIRPLKTMLGNVKGQSKQDIYDFLSSSVTVRELGGFPGSEMHRAWSEYQDEKAMLSKSVETVTETEQHSQTAVAQESAKTVYDTEHEAASEAGSVDPPPVRRKAPKRKASVQVKPKAKKAAPESESDDDTPLAVSSRRCSRKKSPTWYSEVASTLPANKRPLRIGKGIKGFLAEYLKRMRKFEYAKGKKYESPTVLLYHSCMSKALLCTTKYRIDFATEVTIYASEAKRLYAANSVLCSKMNIHGRKTRTAFLLVPKLFADKAHNLDGGNELVAITDLFTLD